MLDLRARDECLDWVCISDRRMKPKKTPRDRQKTYVKNLAEFLI